MNFFKTITFRLTLWYLIVFAVLSGTLGVGTYLSLSSTLRNNLDNELASRARQLVGFRDLISIVASGTFEESQGEYLAFYYYRDDRLESFEQRRLPFPIDRRPIDKAMSGQTAYFDSKTFGKGRYRVYCSYYEAENVSINPGKFTPQEQRREPPEKRNRNDRRKRRERNNRFDERQNENRRPEQNRENRLPQVSINEAVLLIAHPSGWIDEILGYLKIILLTAMPVTLLLSAIGGFFLAQRALKPVKAITETARKISENDLTQRIKVKTRDELGTLSDTINRMISRLENAFKRQKEFTSDASHELRAPLAVIQAEATLALQKQREPEVYQKTIEIIASEAEQMNTLTNQLLELARVDSGRKEYSFESVGLTSFVQETCDEIAVLCNEKNIRFEQKLRDVPPIMGERSFLRRILFNLLTNAINYTDEGGFIQVSLYQEHRHIIMTLTDSGIGIPASDLPHIFDRFYRVDKARSRDGKGSGLGLSICKQLVELHNGRIGVKSTVGKGTRFEIVFPISTKERYGL